MERPKILKNFREGKYDVLVGINLLREGLDLPEVSLVAILDADKEGFLRNETTLIQTMGRAARHLQGRVILYADKMTDSIKGALEETNRRREIQMGYNKKNNITPTTIKRPIEEQMVIVRNAKHIPKKEKERLIPQIEKEMRQAAENLDFELAIELREQLRILRGEKEGKEEVEEI